MWKKVASLGAVALLLAVMAIGVGIPPAADAGQPVSLKAELVEACANCQSNVPGTYSLLPDNSILGYEDGNGVISQILTHNSVYTLDTSGTLVNGVVGSGTRFVNLHFFSPVEGRFKGHVLPPCWDGDYDQAQAVNWSVFTPNSTGFSRLAVGESVDGFARMDFNVRNGFCDNQIYRYFLRWYNACTTRTASGWEVTSGPCGAMNNYGEANLRGQGGRKKETLDYGDWRLSFKLILTPQ
ncbi:MAG: hypothetical protein L0338_22675 [Acidobacteria bacterium]|nr:hypothetical protein [Acidobacteriota bacterium]